jgi:tRNA pseudouridine13 synthase
MPTSRAARAAPFPRRPEHIRLIRPAVPQLSSHVTIRQSPSDFIVVEATTQQFQSVLRIDRSASAAFAAYELTKESLTTPAAAGMLAQRLGVRIADVQYAGLKDKHARTTQVVTLRLRDDSTGSADALPNELAHQGIRARFLGYFPRAITAGDIATNHFTIVVRDLSRRAWEVLDNRQSLLRVPPADSAQPARLLIPNYFGDQRFASVRRGQFAAKFLIQGDFESALKVLIATPLRKESGASKTASRLCAQHWGDWPKLLSLLGKSTARPVIAILASRGTFRDAFEALPHLDRQMTVESLQSHLWNATAANIIRQVCPRGWIEPGATTDLAFPNAADVTARLRDARVPMPSPDLPPSFPDADLWSDPLHAALAGEHLTLAQLTIPGLRRPSFDHFDRPLFVEAQNFTATAPIGTPRLTTTLAFNLPSGAYATNVLRAMGQ